MRFKSGLFSLAAGGALLFSSPSFHSVQAQTNPVSEKSICPVPAEVSQLKETEEEQQFVELVNKERLKRGLSRLTVDPTLIAVARLHSAEMRDKAYFNHESPTNGLKTPMDRYLKVVGTASQDPNFYACVGENLFWATVVDVNRGHQAFMNSPTHRENVLFPRFEKIGVGIVKKDNGEFWVTQMYVTNSDPKSVAKRMAKSH